MDCHLELRPLGACPEKGFFPNQTVPQPAGHQLEVEIQQAAVESLPEAFLLWRLLVR